MGRRGIQGSYSDLIVLLPTTPKTTGGNVQLANGQIGLFRDVSTNDGMPAVADPTIFKNANLHLEVGSSVNSSVGGYTNKGLRSVSFKPEDVKDVLFEPSKAAQVAKVYLGYDGLDLNKSIRLFKGQTSTVTLRLTGEPLGQLGYEDGVFMQTFTFGEPSVSGCEDDSCEELTCDTYIHKLQEDILDSKVRDGITIGDLIKVATTVSCETDPTPTGSVTFYSLTLCDNGDDAALGLVQAKAGGLEVVRTGREGNQSTYTVYKTTGTGAPANYVAPTLGVETDCEGDCPAGYTKNEGGFLYSFATEDDGVDLSTTLLDSLAGLSDQVGSIKTVTNSGTDAARTVGTYSAVSGATSGAGSGATFNVVVTTGGVTAVTLVAKGLGYEVGDTITILNTSLGSGVGAANLVITVASLATTAITNTKVGQVFGVGKYVFVFNTKLTNAEIALITAAYPTLQLEFVKETTSVCIQDAPTSTAWVTGEACGTIQKSYFIDLQDTDCGDSRLVELQEAFPNLTITEDGDNVADCRRRYLTTVTSSFVCDSCHKDSYTFEKPTPFGLETWQEVVVTPATPDSCSCGLYFEAKEFKTCPPKELADQIATRVGQIRIEVSGGEQPEGTPVGYRYYTGNPYAVTHVQRPFDGTGWGFQYIQTEKESYRRLVGIPSGGNYAEQWFKGMTSKLEPCEQYDTISIKVENEKHLGGFSSATKAQHRYIFVIPKGTANTFKPFFNMVSAGNPSIGSI